MINGRAVRVGLVGAAHAHAAIDAGNLRALGAELVGAVDHDDPARLADLARTVGVEPLPDIAALAARAPDVVVVTPRTGRVSQLVATLLTELDDRACVFVNKVAAATPQHVAALDAIATGGASRFGTGSVLAFAPAVRSLAARIADRELLALSVVVQHDAAAFRTPERAWQDDPADGGGTLLSVGTHAWQLVDVLLPGAVLTGVTGGVRSVASAVHRSEDVGVISGMLVGAGVGGGSAEIPVQVTVSGLPGPDLYAVEVLTDAGLDGARLTDRDGGAELGFVEFAEALLAATTGARTLLPWSSSRVVVANAIAAAAAARG